MSVKQRTIFSLGLLLLAASIWAQDPARDEPAYSVGLQMNLYKGYVFNDFAVSPALRIVRHTSIIDVGLVGGFRHRAHGHEWINALGLVELPNNLLDAKETEGQFNDPGGNIELTYHTSRFFQTYAHLYLGKSLWRYRGLSVQVNVSPGIEYADYVAPISLETVNFINDRPTADKYELYEIAYKRFLAYGVLAGLDIQYRLGRMHVATGYERAEYFKGNQFDNLFLRIGVAFD